MAVWNVALPVIANLEAVNADAALDRLHAALTAAGFEVYTDYFDATAVNLSPFVADEGTEPELLPGEGGHGLDSAYPYCALHGHSFEPAVGCTDCIREESR